MTAAFPAALWARIRSFPFASTFAIVLLLQLVGEQFPFSPFPMYAGFSDETTVIYVTDADDKPLPIRKRFRVTAAKLKKVFETKLDFVCERNGYGDGDATLADRQEAGKYAVGYLVEQVKTPFKKEIESSGLKIMRTTLLMDKKGFTESTELVAETPKTKATP